MSEPVVPTNTGISRRTVLIGAGAAVVVVLALIVWGIAASKNSARSASSDDSTSVCPAVSVADQVLPSVVTLTVDTPSGSSGGTGSGEVIRDGGYVLTNNHVISAAVNGGAVHVLFSSGESKPAKIVGRSVALDLAVLKVDTSEHLPVIATGDSDNLQVGQPVVALGAPLGLDGTVTSGIVSALGRQVPVPADNDETAILPGAIQTDASINPGNSGGALVDCAGRLVGINTAIATVPNASGQAGGGSVGIGFAIPVSLALTVTDQLISTGHFEPPTTGVSTLPVTQEVAQRFGVSGGLYVASVESGGPGAAAGLQTGDVIKKVDGEPVDHPISLFSIVVNKKPGDKVQVEYVRDGDTKTTTMTLG